MLLSSVSLFVKKRKTETVKNKNKNKIKYLFYFGSICTFNN